MKKVLLIAASAFILFALGSVLYSSFKIVDLFESLSDELFDEGYVLKADTLRVTNVRTGTDTIIPLKGITLINFWSPENKASLGELSKIVKFGRNNPWLHVYHISFDTPDTQLKKLDAVLQNLPSYYLKDSIVFRRPKLYPRSIILKNNVVVRDISIGHDWEGPETKQMIDTLTRQPGFKP